MSRRRQNPYVGGNPETLEARKRGYPARSVFKLEEIQKKTQILKPGMHVVDLGAAPGSWSLYVSQKLGPKGKLLAIDLQEISQGFGPNVDVVQGDAFDVSSEVLSRFAPYDVVLSDMAPRTSGIKMRDQVMSFELFERALEVSKTLGKPGSSFVCKIFMGPEFDDAIAMAKKAFGKTRVIRPSGVRTNSKETFLVGMNLRATAIES